VLAQGSWRGDREQVGSGSLAAKLVAKERTHWKSALDRIVPASPRHLCSGRAVRSALEVALEGLAGALVALAPAFEALKARSGIHGSGFYHGARIPRRPRGTNRPQFETRAPGLHLPPRSGWQTRR
jgi:hypothetical protein